MQSIRMVIFRISAVVDFLHTTKVVGFRLATAVRPLSVNSFPFLVLPL